MNTSKDKFNPLLIHQKSMQQSWKKASKIKTSPSATFGRSERNNKYSKLIPGPGAYQLNKSTMDRGMMTFKGSKTIRSQTESPGPSAYRPKIMFSSKKYSFQKSENKSKQQIKPSPMTYNLINVNKTQSITFPKKQRDDIVDKDKALLPGPAKYLSPQRKNPKNQFSFTKAKKFIESEQQFCVKQKLPGPTAYQLSNNRYKIKSTKFTKALRSFFQNDKNPGPGAYEVKNSSLSHQGSVITRQKRQFDYDNHVPGPGNYKDVPIEFFKHKEGGCIINKSMITSKEKDEPTLGPGYYFKNNQSSTEKIPGGVIGKQERNSKKIIVLGINQMKLSHHAIGENVQKQPKVYRRNSDFQGSNLINSTILNSFKRPEQIRQLNRTAIINR